MPLNIYLDLELALALSFVWVGNTVKIIPFFQFLFFMYTAIVRHF